MKSPDLKLGVPRKQFEALLESDPAAAEAQVKKMPGSWAKEELLATIAKHSRDSQPQKSIEKVAGLLTANENPLNRSSHVRVENGGHGSGLQNPVRFLKN